IKTDLEGNYTYVNQYFCARMGIKEQNAIGMIGMAHIIPDDHELTLKTVQDCFANPEIPQKVILRKPLADGSIVHTDWDFTYLPEREGQPGEVVCIGFDVTEIINDKDREMASIIQSTNAIYWKMDLTTGQFTYMDPKMEKLLGWPADSWKDMETWAARIHPDDRHYAITYCNCSTEQGEDHEFEYRALAKDGSFIWLKDVVTVIKSEGKPVELIGFMVDISQQKKAQQTLSLQAEILDRVGQAVIATKANGQVITWNKKAEQLYKYTKEEAIGQLIQDIVPTSQSKEEVYAMWKMLKAGKTTTGEYTLNDRHGRPFPAHVIHTPFFNEHGWMVAIIGVSIDLTEQKKAQQTLSLQAKILDNIAQSVIALAPDFTVMTWNKKAEELYKFTKEEAIGQNAGELIQSEMTEEQLQALRAKLNAGQTNYGEYLLTDRYGKQFPARVIHTPFLNEKGETVAYIGVSYDLSKQKKAESLEKKARQLESKNEELQ
ncbi:MAG: PAS domain S-box protein, partial [Bacteroidota bacterium]